MKKNYQEACEKMIISQLMPVGIRSESVLQAMRTIPREAFLPQEFQLIAYAAKEIPLNKDRSIAEPIVIGKLMQACELDGSQNVLIIGDASGYVGVLLSENARHVTMVDKAIHIETVQKNLEICAKAQNKSFDNIAVLACENLLEYQPEDVFDVIIIHGAIRQMPEFLLKSLSPQGFLLSFIKKSYICEFTKAYYAIVPHATEPLLQKEILGECSLTQNADFNPKPTFKF